MAENDTEQAPEHSVEDRIGNLFGSSAEEPEGEPEAATPTEIEAKAEETAPETFEVEVDGQKYTLPKALEKAVMQERDYTQKSQGIAEQRRTIEVQQSQARVASMESQFQREVANELQEAAMLDAVIRQAQATDMSQLPLDELIRKRMELDGLKERKGALDAAIEAKRNEWGERQAQAIQELRSKSLEVIKQRIPGFNETIAKEIRSHAISEGYTEAELNAIFDPRHAVTLWKAAQYDHLKSAAKPAVAKSAPVKTTPTEQMPAAVRNKFAYQKAVGKAAKGSREHQQLVQTRIGQIFG